MPIVKYLNGKKYLWDPTKSMPNCSGHISEMHDVLDALKENKSKVIIDFGCGNCRNSRILSRHFKKVILVELQNNISNVTNWVKEHRLNNCRVLKSEDFYNSSVRADVCFLSFVLHTIPRLYLRKRLILELKGHLKKTGVLVFIVPSHDSKYTSNNITKYEEYNDGIIKTYKDSTFTYYKSYNIASLKKEFNKLSLKVTKKIPGKNRYIFITKFNRV